MNGRENMRNSIFRIGVMCIAITCFCFLAQAGDVSDLAEQLANPVASLIRVPIVTSYDQNIGADDNGVRFTINVQPVIPFSLNDNWKIISRTILPIVYQKDVSGSDTEDFGISDTMLSLFFCPKNISDNGIIWGIGPILFLPTASKNSLGTEKWGIGPTGVIFRQKAPWSYGLLVNHVQSFAGDSDRNDISATLLQPFANYITKTKTTISINAESSYDWENDIWSIPITFSVSQLLKIGKKPIQTGCGVRYWVQSPEGGPEGWGFRLTVTLLL